MPWKNQGGGPWGSGPKGPWGSGPQSSGPRPPDLEDLLRRGQDKLQTLIPGGNFSGVGIALVLVAALAVWGLSGFFRVQSEELGVVLRFGKHVRTVQPGLNYHLPYPIETVLLPKALRVSTLSIGMRVVDDSRRGGTTTIRDVPEESLMLTGDENIVDIDFTVLWQVKDAGQYLFNVVDPSRTIKQVAESAIREVVGKNNIQFILTEGRTKIADDTRRVMQAVLDGYNAGVVITQVALQRTEPPASVIDAFRDVQAAQADRERAQNEAEAYRNDIIPRARGEAQRLLQQAEAYKQEVIANAQGDASRFTQVYNEYRLAKDVTTKRMYLETMEQLLRGTNKVIIDGHSGQGVLPYLPLPELQKKQPQQSQQR